VAEMIYSVVATEFIMYLYDETSTYENFEAKSIKKLKLLLNANHGGNHHD